jgi:V/A-type H+-transporting ATPase subunit I
MSRVELVVPEPDVVPVTEALAASGVFHPVLDMYADSYAALQQASEWQEWAANFAALERRILTVMEELGMEPGAPPAETPHLVDPQVAQIDIERLEHEAHAPVQSLQEEQHRLTRLQRAVGQLELIADLDVDLDTLRNLEYTFVLLGSMPLANVERLQSSLEHIPSVLVILRRDTHLATVMLFGMRRDADILNRAARSAYLNPLNVPPHYRGTPREVIEGLQAGIERTRRHIEEYEENIHHLYEMRREHLCYLLWRIRASRKLVETIAHYDRLRYAYLVTGWVPASRVGEVRERIGEVSDEVLVEVANPQRQDEGRIPMALENPSFLKAFQSLVTNYGYPSYGEIDPTPVFALTFLLVFGIMFGDVGHGLVLLLLGLALASGRVVANRGLIELGKVIGGCGISSMIFGVLYGSVFGFESWLSALWIRPVENIMGILLTTVGVGVGILTLGMVFNILNAALGRRWGYLLFDQHGLTGLLFYWSLLALAAAAFWSDFPISPVFPALCAAFMGVILIFGEALERIVAGQRPVLEGGVSLSLMQGFFELFETVIGMLSNTLSYVRMGAFAVAHGSLSMVIFIIAGIASPQRGFGYWLVIALGNLFVIGFEGMVVGIQTLRLEYYEFFSKFFSGGGIRYHPLSLVPREKK